MHAGHGDIFKELPHSLEAVTFDKEANPPPANVSDVTKVPASCHVAQLRQKSEATSLQGQASKEARIAVCSTSCILVCTCACL